MKTYKIVIELLSDALPGSGEGFGAVIDTDIVFDDSGIPYIPAKRIKGCLKTSFYEVVKMLSLSSSIPANINDIEDAIFGKKGNEDAFGFNFQNLYLTNFEDYVNTLGYLNQKYADIFSRESILDSFTFIRSQTSINDNGIADEHSLRTIRVIRKGLSFSSNIISETDDTETEKFFALACATLRRMGTKRNRGLGEIICTLEGNVISTVIDNLEREIK